MMLLAIAMLFLVGGLGAVLFLAASDWDDEYDDLFDSH